MMVTRVQQELGVELADEMLGSFQDLKKETFLVEQNTRDVVLIEVVASGDFQDLQQLGFGGLRLSRDADINQAVQVRGPRLVRWADRGGCWARRHRAKTADREQVSSSLRVEFFHRVREIALGHLPEIRPSPALPRPRRERGGWKPALEYVGTRRRTLLQFAPVGTSTGQQ